MSEALAEADAPRCDRQKPHLVGDESAERDSFLAAIRCDLEALRGEVRQQEKSRLKLVDAAPAIYAALKDGVPKEAILRVLSRRGYTGTRSMFMYFVRTSLEREVIRHGITPEGWVLATIPGDAAAGQQQKGLKRDRAKTRVRRTEQQQQRIDKLAEQRSCHETNVKIFKDAATTERSEFDKRLAAAVRERKESGEWARV